MTTRYTATAVRSDGWWAIEITSGLPEDMLGVTQTHRLNNIELVATEVIADLLECDIQDIQVDVTIELTEALDDAVNLFSEADAMEQAARAEASRMRSQAAADLLRAHLTMREAGQLLDISQQRIKQLVDRIDDNYGTASQEARRLIREQMSVEPHYRSHDSWTVTAPQS